MTRSENHTARWAALPLTLPALSACGKPKDKPVEAPAATASSTAASIAGPGRPDRRPGLRSQAMTMDGKPLMTTRFCIDTETDKKMEIWGNDMGGDCTQTGPDRNLDGSFSFSATCTPSDGMTMKTTGRASGDFSSAYAVEMDSETSGAPQGDMNGKHKMTLAAKWEGACPSGWAPGDMEMPGGMRMSVLKLAALPKDDPEAAAKAAMAEILKNQ